MEGLSMESDSGLNIPLSSPLDASTSSCSRPKQLIFDRRYGWVFEEWVEPSEHANVGGRGLFSVVPLTAATVNLTYQAANAAADLVVQSIQNRSEIAADIRNRWTSARLVACQELKKHVNYVPFLRKRSFPALSGVGAKVVEVQRHPILQSGSRFTRDLTDRAIAIGATVSNEVHDGMHILQQAFHDGRVRANERLHEGRVRANAAADLVVQSIENRAEIAADIRNTWTSARLVACQELKKHVNYVAFLRKRSFPALSGVGAKVVEVQRHPILQSGSRFTRDLTDRVSAIGATVSNEVHDGMHILQQAFHEGRVRANERLRLLLPDVERRQEASAYVQTQEVFPFPPELMDRSRRVLAKAGEHLHQILLVRYGEHIDPAMGAGGVVNSMQAAGQVGLGPHIFSEVLSQGRALGHELSRQAKGCFELLGHVLETQQTGQNLSHLSMDGNDDSLKVHRSKSQEARASLRRAEIEDPEYDDEELSRSPLLTMVAADGDDQSVQAPESSQSTARVIIRSTASPGRRNRKKFRKGKV